MRQKDCTKLVQKYHFPFFSVLCPGVMHKLIENAVCGGKICLETKIRIFVCKGGEKMAMSSILTNVKIVDPKKIESFIKALDASADDPKREPSTPVSRQMTNIDEIRRLMAKKVLMR